MVDRNVKGAMGMITLETGKQVFICFGVRNKSNLCFYFLYFSILFITNNEAWNAR